MKILKFGGSSVATPQRIQQIIAILATYHAKNEQFAVVFSAFGGLTDVLIAAGKLAEKGDILYKNELQTFADRHRTAVYTLVPDNKAVIAQIEQNIQDLAELLHGVSLTRELSMRTQDVVVSFGERSSNLIIAAAMSQAGISSEYLDARKVVRTDANFGNAKIDFTTTYDLIKTYFKNTDKTQIVTGFIGETETGLTTTLGRGGSDYTGAIFAAALDAEVLEIWTDVNGVLTADPRKVPTAFTVPEMSYAEAMEMSHFGAKVIYPPTIQPVLQKNIPLRILNTFNPSHAGTLVTNTPALSEQPIKGISSISQIALITVEGSGMVGVPGTASRLFGSLAQAKINVILITQGSSEHSITFAVMPNDATAAQTAVENEFAFELRSNALDPLKIDDKLCVIAVIGENMKARTGIAGQLFGALGKNGINIIAIAQGSSELNISAVVPKKDEAKALQALHEGFFLSEITILHVFVVGVGLIGSALLEQIKRQTAFLRKARRLELRIVALANSKQMVFDENGIDLSDWKNRLAQAEKTPLNMSDFIAKMRAMNLPNSVFIDNTANANVAKHYAEILDASISISTPNKIAASSDYATFSRLKTIADRRGVLFLYETNVGAGLPVITTLADLINSGDEIRKIEGVLSGTLSFIFNTFNKNTPFCDIVREAHQLGYTEPDPREDLSGADVRRKLLILAREAGLHLETEDIKIEGLLSEKALSAPSVEAFFAVLDTENEVYAQKLAANEGKVLRFVASLEGETATISLKAFDPSHPFASLSGSDNMIVFTTERYHTRPLVVRGPGAGAEVTAAGVFAEVIRIASFLA
jgi:bifunctional aspartokinase / homoserine dehydrogenase 1